MSTRDNIIRRHVDGTAPINDPQNNSPTGWYDNQGNFYQVVDTPPPSYSYGQAPYNPYEWWGNGFTIGNFWMWFWGLLIFALLILGTIGFGFSISNGNKIHMLESSLSSVQSTVASQQNVLNQLTTPFALTSSGALSSASVRQTLNCGAGPCAMTLPSDLSAYGGLPEICVVSAAPYAHTVTVSGPAFFQPGDNAVATFAGGDVGESFCFTVISSTIAAVTSANGVSF